MIKERIYTQRSSPWKALIRENVWTRVASLPVSDFSSFSRVIFNAYGLMITSRTISFG